jgi:prevent-host-death family protein
MRTVGAFEAKTHLSELLERVEHGEEFTITKHGKPVARLCTIGQRTDQSTTRAAIQRLKALASEYTLDADWKELRDFGRK